MEQQKKQPEQKRNEVSALILSAPCTYILANKMQCNRLSTAGTCARHTLLAGMFGTTIPTAEVAYEILGGNQ